MPLRVHCPNGCLIRMPNNRAGRIVRCPKCKSPIRLPAISESELASGGPVNCQARIATPRNADQAENAGDVALNQSPEEHETIGQDQSTPSQPDPMPTGLTLRLPVPDVSKPAERKKLASQMTPKKVDQESDPLTITEGAAAHSESAASSLVEDSAKANDDSVNHELATAAEPPINQPETLDRPIIDHESDAESPEDWIDGEGVQIVIREMPKSKRGPKPGPKPKSPGDKKLKTDASGESKNAASSGVAPVQVKPNLDGPSTKAMHGKQRAIDRVELPKPKTKTASSKEGPGVAVPNSGSRVANSTSPLLIDLGPVSGKLEGPLTAEDWQERLEKANSDRKVLARFFALCLCIVAIVNMIPAIYHWYYWTQLTDSLPLPRWIYILIFVGAVHLIYAIFLAQVPDWSALRAVALAMLAVAFVFGFVSTGLLAGGGQGNLSGFLGIPFALSRQACIWCVAMLCLATLMSYWGGKESSNWQRAEQLLSEILSTPTGQS